MLLPNEERVPLLDHTHFMTHQNGSLTIVNVSDVDSGPYVCRAWNAAGSDCVYIDVYNMHPREYLPATSTKTARSNCIPPSCPQPRPAHPPSITGAHSMLFRRHQSTGAHPHTCTATHMASPLPSSRGPVSTLPPHTITPSTPSHPPT